MKLCEIIVKAAIIIDMKAQNRKDAILELLETLCSAGRMSAKEEALSRLEARERAGTTGIGDGVAIPHGATPGVHQPIIAIGRSSIGIDFNSMDGKPANLIFLILVPEQGAGLHLRILAHITHMLSIPGFINLLISSQTPAELMAAFEEKEHEIGEMNCPDDLPKICIAGAGNGGLAMAAHCSLLGCKVRLFNRGEERLAMVKVNEGIYATGEVHGFAKIHLITTSPKEAVEGVDIVMVVTPATAHRDIANLIGPYLSDGQIVILNPGRTGGALEFAAVLRKLKISTKPFIAEAETLLYACRVTNPAQVKIYAVKNSVPLATIPAYHIPDVLPIIRKVLPQFVPGDNVLKTSLSNIGSVFHPALTILNAAWIEERHGDFNYYHEGASPSVAKVLEALDNERVAIAAALGIKVPTAREWLYLAYGSPGGTLYDAMQANSGYSGIKAPNSLDHRYITEDVPTSLVPMASFGDHLGVPVPTIKAFIHIANILHKRDYFKEGRTIERLGLTGLTVKQIRRLVEEGKLI